ncbi:YveK family protein [Paenibacillus antarcticus]|nr:Wzz/FepE/Etk N-terminal domain-containing protein [Paenibacillus antarcticus]
MMELKLLISMIRKRLWMIIVFVILCSSSVGIYTIYFTTPIYEASSTLIINKSNMDSEGKPTLDMNQINSNILLINSYKVIISSATIMDKVVKSYPELKVSSEDLMERIKVITTQNSQIITLQIRDSNYEQAMQIVNAIGKVFKDEIPHIMKVDNISILDLAKPQLDVQPVSPKVKIYIVIAFVASLMLAIGIVLLIEYLDDTIKNEQDVERYLGLTTLGTIQKIKKKDLRKRSRSRSKEQAGEKYASVSQ